MVDFFSALLHDLESRCAALAARLSGIASEPDLNAHVVAAYRDVGRVRQDVGNLLQDPALTVPSLLTNHLQLYKRWKERIQLIESYCLPFVERYNDDDRRMTRLCRRLVEQASWPLPAPLVAASSSNYYWTVVAYNLVCVPAAELTTLLGIPDLCHELGHHLVLVYEAALYGDFRRRLAAYIKHEKERISAAQRPPQYAAAYDLLAVTWGSKWVVEFVCDMAATYLAGPAFGYQHVRLCAGNLNEVYHPSLGEMAEHPADEARLRGIVATLRAMSLSDASARVLGLWDGYMGWNGETKPQDYDLCYPQALIDALAGSVVAGCRALNIKSFAEIDPVEGAILTRVQESWDAFMADPQTFAIWEQARLPGLWSSIGV